MGIIYSLFKELFKINPDYRSIVCRRAHSECMWRMILKYCDGQKDRMGGKGKIDVQRFKGLGEMDAKDLKDTTMNPMTRKLIKVSLHDDEPGETADLVERLMGKKPELRFQYIQENARFVEELDV
jgi:DNA gyrase/topoisomerase IV subunit B